MTTPPVRYHDLDDLAGTWVPDPAFDQAIEDMHRVEHDLLLFSHDHHFDHLPQLPRLP